MLPRRVAFPRGARFFLFAVFLGAAILAIGRGAIPPRRPVPARFDRGRNAEDFRPRRPPRSRRPSRTWRREQGRETAWRVSPRGVFNFATGLRNPLREDQIVPGHLDALREREVAARIESAGPRFLILANQPTAAFGRAVFGEDYARAIREAIRRRYRLAASFGEAPPDAPVGDPRFFLRIYERVGP